MSSPQAGKSAFVFVFITVLVDSIGFGIILPVLPRLIMQLTGVSIDQAAEYGGGLSFVYALMQFFCAPILGNLSDAFGRRPVLLFALLALGCDYFIMGFAPTIGWLFVGRLIAGIAGASFTPAYAYVADITEPAKRAQSFGLMGAAFGVGFILGPAIGGLLGNLSPRAPFFVAGAIALTNSAFGYFALPESLPLAARRAFHWARANPLGTLAQVRKYPVVTWLLAALFLWQLGHQVLPSIWAFYTISKFNWTSAQVGYSLAWVGMVMAIAQGLLTRVLIPWLGGERRAALAGMAAAVRGLSRLCLRDPGLDDVRRVAEHLHLRAQLPLHERHRLAAHTRERAGGAAGSGGVSLQSELHSRSAADDAGVRPLLESHGAGPLSRRPVPGGRGAHRRLRRAVRARTAHVPGDCGGATAGAT